jgi:hypothetical protein
VSLAGSQAQEKEGASNLESGSPPRRAWGALRSLVREIDHAVWPDLARFFEDEESPRAWRGAALSDGKSTCWQQVATANKRRLCDLHWLARPESKADHARFFDNNDEDENDSDMQPRVF